MPYTEASYEKAIIQLFEEMGYTHVCGYDIDCDYQISIYGRTDGSFFNVNL